MHRTELTAAGAIIYDFCLNDEEHCTARYQTPRQHTHSSISPTANEHNVRRLGQTLQPHFSPSIPRVNSTRYLQDTKDVSMATLRNKLICTPGLAPCEDSNCGTCGPRRWLSGPHPAHTPLPSLATEPSSCR